MTKPLKVDAKPAWTKSDGVEVCFAFPDNNAQHPTFVLHGFPNGSYEGSTEAGAPQNAVDALVKDVTFRATVQEKSWTAEWTIPLAAADIEAVAGLELDFNIGIFRRESQAVDPVGRDYQPDLARETGRANSAGEVTQASPLLLGRQE